MKYGDRLLNAFLPSIVLMMPRMFYRGIILYFCWLWFIVPIFGVAVIPLWEAIPISGLASLLTFEKIGKACELREAWIRVGEWAVGATVFFVAAYIFHIIRT